MIMAKVNTGLAENKEGENGCQGSGNDQEQTRCATAEVCWRLHPGFILFRLILMFLFILMYIHD